MKNSNLLIVTGLSGAGMSSALKVLEDSGYEVLDNFPLSLLDQLLKEKTDRPIAIGIDTRTRHFDPDLLLKENKARDAFLLFIECDEQELQKRFNETRRKHPLAKDRTVLDGIAQEKTWLHPLKDKADLVINTTDLSIHDLRRHLEGQFDHAKNETLNISIMSFGFKHGVPREADIVMDVRFLKNPHWEEKLRPLTGQNKEVADYIQKDESFSPFIENFKALIEPLINEYKKEGKNYLTIAFGCTGGKHRSVFTAKTIAKWLEDNGNTAHIKHRDMPTN